MLDSLLTDSSAFTTYVMSTGTLLAAAFTSIISVANPLAAMTVFISLTEDNTDRERIQIARKASLYMFLVLITFLLAGTWIMSFFGISLPGIRIAGGLIIMRAAYDMLSPEKRSRLSEEDQQAAMDKEDVSFSPLAMPMLSGPGSIAVVIGLASQARGAVDLAVVTGAILLVTIISYGVLRIAPVSARYIGPSGMSAVTRMMGFIAMAIAVQFILSGVGRFFGIG